MSYPVPGHASLAALPPLPSRGTGSRGSDLHQGADMSHRTRGQCVQAIAPFQYRYDAAVARHVGDLHQFPGDPMKVAVLQVHASKGIQAVRVESSGDNEDFRGERR